MDRTGSTQGTEPMKTKRPSLKRIAAYINANMPGYTAKVVEGHCNTDRHPRGVRWRIEGKGRYGNHLIVANKAGVKVVDHNSAETYRHNGEVMQFLEDGIYRGSFFGEHHWGEWTPAMKRRRKAWQKEKHAERLLAQIAGATP